MQDFRTKRLMVAAVTICASCLALNSITVSACHSIFVHSTPLSEFLTPVLSKSEIQSLVGSSYPSAKIKGYVNVLIDGYDACSEEASGPPLVLVLPEGGAVRVFPDPVSSGLKERCSSVLFTQDGRTVSSFSTIDGKGDLSKEAIQTNDSDIGEVTFSDLEEFVKRCKVELTGVFKEVGNDLFLEIELITSLTRYTGKLELKYLHDKADRYKDYLCDRATIRRAATDSWHWIETGWFGTITKEAKRLGLDCPKVMRN